TRPTTRTVSARVSCCPPCGPAWRRRRHVPRAGLSRDAVVALAVEVLDADPHAPVTLAAVAARAGVAVPSLYKHVSSLDELRDAVAVVGVSRIADAVADAVAGLSGGAAVRAAGRAIRAGARPRSGRSP